MERLNKDIINIIVGYLDHQSVRELTNVYLDDNVGISCVILLCAVDKLMLERNYIASSLDRVNSKLSDLEHLSDMI